MRDFCFVGSLRRRGTTGDSSNVSPVNMGELFPSAENDSKTWRTGESLPSRDPKSYEKPAIPMVSKEMLFILVSSSLCENNFDGKHSLKTHHF